MSILARLLQAKEPLLDTALSQLETRTGRKGVDAKLTAEIAQKAATITRQLGLAIDCDGPTLYAALTTKIAEQDAHLAKTLGGSDVENVAEMVPLAIRRLEQIDP
jgi:hypothetical protein